MRQFILGGSAYPSGAVDASESYGNVGFAYLDKSSNKIKFTATGNEILPDGEGYLVLVRQNENMGNVVFPIHKNHFSYVKGEYDDSMYDYFTATFEVPEVDAFLDYTVIIVKKGKGFNERNKWTASVHTKASDTAETVAAKLAAAINANIGADVTAEVSANEADTPANTVITITGKVKGVDYNIVLADELEDVEVEQTNVGMPYGSADYVKDLANKAAADAGFEYTFDDSPQMLYPKYPLNPLDSADSADAGFTIFTLRFAEPRDVKTRDEVVHQIVQVAFPTGSSAISTFEAVCEVLASGIESS